MSNLVIDAEKITRVFPVPGGEFTALKGVDAKVEAGTFCILRGRSGSGKTTLMNIIGTLDDPTSGTVSIGGRPIKGMSLYDREELRRKELGFVFQSVSLIPSLNASKVSLSNISAVLKNTNSLESTSATLAFLTR